MHKCVYWYFLIPNFFRLFETNVTQSITLMDSAVYHAQPLTVSLPYVRDWIWKRCLNSENACNAFCPHYAPENWKSKHYRSSSCFGFLFEENRKNRDVVIPKCSVLRGLLVSVQMFFTDISPYTSITLTGLKPMC